MTTSTPEIVGIAGGSCSGKTTLEHNLTTILGDRIIFFPFDDMFVGLAALTGRTITDWEDPNLYRWGDFIGHLHDLKNGRPTTIATHSRESTTHGITSRRIEPRPLVAVTGFLALHHPQARELFDTTIYLDLPEDELIRRRLARANPDDPWDSIDYITTALLPGHRRVVLPQRGYADHILDATRPPDQLAAQLAALLTAQRATRT